MTEPDLQPGDVWPPPPMVAPPRIGKLRVSWREFIAGSIAWVVGCCSLAGPPHPGRHWPLGLWDYIWLAGIALAIGCGIVGWRHAFSKMGIVFLAIAFVMRLLR